ncbi:hypothetical protein SPFM12_00163 [Salmonella phage SPFM12]|nr:hypothetical protein SPFM12_00163 [Salmonella phage SPFM12]
MGDCTIKDYRLDVPPLFNGDDGWTLTFRIVIRTILPDSAVENAHFSWYCVNDHDTDVEPKPAAPNYTTIDQVEWKQVIIRPEDATLSGYQPDFRFEDTDKWRWWWMLPATNGTDAGVAPPQSIVYRADADFNTIVEALFPNDDAGFIIGFWFYGGCTWQEKFENNIYDGRSGMTNPANGEDYIIADARACSDPGSTSMEVEQHDIDLGHLARVDINPVKADTEEVNWYGCTLLRVTYGGVCDNGDALACKVIAVQNFMEQQAVRFRINSQSNTVEVAYSRDENGDIVFRSEDSKLAETPFTDGISYDYKYPSVFYTAHEYTYIDAKDKFFRRACYLLWRITGEPRYKAALDSLKGSVNQMGNAADAEVWFIEHGGYLFDRNEPWHNRPVHTPKDTSINGVYLINYASQVPVDQDGDVIESGLPDAQKGTVQFTSKGPRYEPDWFVVWTGEKVVDWNTMLNDPTGYTPMWGGSSKVPDYLIVNPEKPYDVKAWGAVNADVQKIKESEDGLID